MTLYYRGPCAVVTHDVLESRCPTYRLFMISDLQGLYVRRLSPAEAVGSSHAMRVVSNGVAALAATLALVSQPIHQSGVTAVALVVLVLAVVATTVARRLRSRPRELWAVYRGQFLRVFATADGRAFNQVIRAVRKARELAEEYASQT
jgi:ABC-type transport system involved in cytochrome bd biosynthesis fused ATPase/permease subunit